MTINNPIRRKRLLSELDESGDNNPPRKEFKTEKEPENSTEIQRNVNFNDTMYKIYIKQAFELLDSKDYSGIDNLTLKVTIPVDDPETIPVNSLVMLLRYLASNVTKLDNDGCSSLIMAIINYQWSTIDDKELLNSYVHFMRVLVSSIPKYLTKVVHKVLTIFTTTSPTAHEILKFIIRYNPTFITKLPGYLQSHFPHHLAPTDQLVSYITNLLQFLEYCNELQYDVWVLIIECCIKLDVELQNDLDDLDDEEIEDLISNNAQDPGEEPEENSSDEDSDEEIESDDDSDEEGQEIYAPITKSKDIVNLVNKLDSILEVLLNKTNDKFQELNDESTVLFSTLTSLFKSHILPTHFTKSIQFLLFNITQQHIELTESFLVMLIDVCFNPDEIIDKRLKSMQYLCSFIARSDKLTKTQIIFVVSYLIGWINKYIDEREFEIYDGGMERFKLFYSTFQGLLYIFCFRYQVLQDGEYWECDIDKFFQRVIITKFNPLKFIDETVCYIFAKIATKLDVCYCYSIIEHNKRETMLTNNLLPNDSTRISNVNILNFKSKQDFLDLQSYFPFDPLVLPVCKKGIVNYIEWGDVNPDDEDETSGDDE